MHLFLLLLRKAAKKLFLRGPATKALLIRYKVSFYSRNNNSVNKVEKLSIVVVTFKQGLDSDPIVLVGFEFR